MKDCIKVNTARLGADAGRMNTAIQKIKSKMMQMEGSVAEMDRMWDGPGCEAFKKAFRDDVKAMNLIIKHLEWVYRYEVKAKQEYEACESRVHELVSGIRI